MENQRKTKAQRLQETNRTLGLILVGQELVRDGGQTFKHRFRLKVDVV